MHSSPQVNGSTFPSPTDFTYKLSLDQPNQVGGGRVAYKKTGEGEGKGGGEVTMVGTPGSSWDSREPQAGARWQDGSGEPARELAAKQASPHAANTTSTQSTLPLLTPHSALNQPLPQAFNLSLCPAQVRSGRWVLAVYNPLHTMPLAFNLTVHKVGRCLHNCSSHGR